LEHSVFRLAPESLQEGDIPEQPAKLIVIWSAATRRRFESGVVPPHSKVAHPSLGLSWMALKLVMSAKAGIQADPQTATSHPSSEYAPHAILNFTIYIVLLVVYSSLSANCCHFTNNRSNSL
jgi:hypothetical protein